MADKGKTKAVDVGPIVLSDDDDSDDDFFVSKRKPVFRAVCAEFFSAFRVVPGAPRLQCAGKADKVILIGFAAPIRSPSPPVRSHSESNDSDDPDNQKKKRKKPIRPKKKVSTLPEWTRHASHEHKSRAGKGSSQIRGSTEGAETIAVNGSDDDIVAIGGSSSTQHARRRIVLTPPPALSEQKRAEVHRLVEEHLGANQLDDDEANASPSSSDEEVGDGETCQISIRMEAPPERRESATAAALKEYQKARTLTVYRNAPLSKGLSILAERLQKLPENLVLVYDGNKVYPRSTAAGLGIIARAEMTGYEKEYWERLESERRAKLVESDDDDDIEPISPVPSNRLESSLQDNSSSQRISQAGSVPERVLSSADGTQIRPSSTIQGTGANLIKFTLRGSDGKEQHFKSQTDMKAITVLRFFAKKTGGTKEDADKLKLVFDGETVDKNASLDDIGVEDGDMFDVVNA